jgi:thioredoxin-like negative regulator of GroEL
VIVVILAPAIAALVIGVVAMSLRVQQRGQLQLVGTVVDSQLALDARTQPSVLFFSSATCAICHTAQRPALDALSARRTSPLLIREVDVAADPDLARRYRVMSLPTTIVIGADGDVVAINAGFASTEKLAAQLAGAGVRELASA